MKIIFIRHAEPDYSIDGLTSKGKKEAVLLSHRTKNWDVDAFFCSPLGRAKETAAPTLRLHHAKATVYDWLQEFNYTAKDPITGEVYKDYGTQKFPVFVEDISLNDVAEWINLSPAYVSRIFKEETGETFVEYISRERITRAKQLLQSTNLSIKDVGFKCGFNNMQTFIRTFKRIENCTPSQYATGITKT